MFVKTTTLLALVSTFAQLTIATPPACVIGAVSKAQNPRDISSICGSPDSYKQYIAQNCGSNQQTAITYFAGICSDAGVTVSTDLPSSSSKSVPSSTSSSSSGAQTASATSGSNSSASSSTSSSSSSGSTTSGSSSSPTGSLTTSIVVVSATASVPAGSATAATASAKPSTGLATRIGMDAVGLAAVGAFGAMLAL